MTHQTRAEFDGEARCLDKNTVALQEAENGALLCSMEIANKPRSKSKLSRAIFTDPGVQGAYNL